MYKIVFILLLSTILACNNEPSKLTKIKCKMQFKKGDILLLKSNATTNTIIEMPNDKPTVNNTNITSSFKYEVIKDSAGYVQLKINLQDYKATLMQNDKLQEISINDSNNTSFNNKFFAKLLHQYYIIQIAPNGTVIPIVSFNKVIDSVVNTMDIKNENMRKSIAQYATALLGNNDEKNNINNGTSFLPDSGMVLKQKWTKESSITNPLPLKIINNYTFKSLENNIAYINADCDINATNSLIEMLGTKVTANLKGSQAAQYKINVTNGLLQNSNVEVSLKGSILAMGKEIPLKIEMKTNTEIMKIK